MENSEIIKEAGKILNGYHDKGQLYIEGSVHGEHLHIASLISNLKVVYDFIKEQESIKAKKLALDELERLKEKVKQEGLLDHYWYNEYTKDIIIPVLEKASIATCNTIQEAIFKLQSEIKDIEKQLEE